MTFMILVIMVYVAVLWAVIGIAIGMQLEWREHRPHCRCAACKRWRADVRKSEQEPPEIEQQDGSEVSR